MTDERLPNPFIVTDTADLMLAALERRLADDLPLYLDPKLLARLEAAVIEASDTPLRQVRAMRLVSRLRERAR